MICRQLGAMVFIGAHRSELLPSNSTVKLGFSLTAIYSRILRTSSYRRVDDPRWDRVSSVNSS